MEHDADRQRSNANLPPMTPSALPHAQQSRKVHIVAVSSLRPGDSPRLGGVDEEHVHRLAEMEATLPPILVHRGTMRVVDGMHRLRAAILTDRKEIEVEFFDGNEEEGFIQAVRANIVHGLPLTLAERRAAAARILSTHPQLSDRAIAAYTGIAHKTVSAIRSRSTGENTQLSVRIGADGRMRPLSSQEGRRRAAEVIAERPNASLREVAAMAGISVGTAHDVRRRMHRGENPVHVANAGMRQDAEQSLAPDNAATAEAPSPKQSRRPRASTTEVDTDAILHSLVRDPAMKQTDTGRALIRWLHSHIVKCGEWDPLLSSVPPYRLQSLAALARQCGNVWHQLAHELESREGLTD
ncbi:ParB/RepB/Spo0J family partition protein [Actinomadura welshii]